MDKIILEKNHIVCGRQLDVQKAQSRDGSQRSVVICDLDKVHHQCLDRIIIVVIIILSTG